MSGAAAYKGLAAVLLEEGAHAEAAAELRMSVEILRALVEHSPRQHFADFAAAVHALVMACRGAPASIDDAAELLSLTRQSHELLRSELRRAPYIEVIDYLEALADLLALAVEPKDRAEALSDAALFAATALASVAWVHRPRSLRARALALDRIAEELRAIGRSDLASAYGEASRRCRSRS
ncbi:MAG: hypothetical protein R3A51_15010 [Nannocystaceae bacterium]